MGSAAGAWVPCVIRAANRKENGTYTYNVTEINDRMPRPWLDGITRGKLRLLYKVGQMCEVFDKEADDWILARVSDAHGHGKYSVKTVDKTYPNVSHASLRPDSGDGGDVDEDEEDEEDEEDDGGK